MNNKNRNRLNSLLVPWFADGALSIVFAATPWLAMNQGANSVMLGFMIVIAQVPRLPLCLFSGWLSEHIGRKQVSIPAAIIVVLACIGLALSRTVVMTTVLFAISVAAMGGFYPPFQAFIGEVSRKGQLTKNLGAFNIGWCVGSAAASLLAAVLWKSGYLITFSFAAVMLCISIVLLLFWRKPKEENDVSDSTDQSSTAIQHNNIWLTIGRLGHYTGFFGYATIRMIFPKLGGTLGWSGAECAAITGLLLWGQGIGILLTGLSPWWRGKIWPQLTAHSIMILSALGMAFFHTKILLGFSFLLFGICLAICYTSAIYYGLAARSKMGKNMGIHEALVAGGQISGGLLGGIGAQYIDLRAPYFTLAGVAFLALVGSAILYTTKIKNAGD